MSLFYVCLALGGVLSLAVLGWVFDGDRGERQRRFEERWPPISDDEFMAACPPGTSRETALRIRRLIADQTEIAYERIHPDQQFSQDLDVC